MPDLAVLQENKTESPYSIRQAREPRQLTLRRHFLREFDLRFLPLYLYMFEVLSKTMPNKKMTFLYLPLIIVHLILKFYSLAW